MWIFFIIIVVAIFLNYFLGAKLYMEPKNKEFFNNVQRINTINMPQIEPDPQYVLLITFLEGCMIGLFLALLNRMNIDNAFGYIFSIGMGILYWIDISRTIAITEDSLILSKALSKEKVIPLESIKGIYIFSFSKKFMKRHDFTTKLVIVTSNKKVKFTLSSLNKKAVLNMIKNNFGVTDYKIFVATNK